MSLDLKDKIIATIEHQQVRPKSRWQFLVQQWFWLGFTGATIVIGAAAVAVMVHHFQVDDISLFLGTPAGSIGFLIGMLPLFWLCLLIVVVIVVYYNIRHTKQGYRYPLYSILIGTVIFTGVLGAVLFVMGIGKSVNTALEEHVPIYSRVLEPHHDLLTRPEAGRLAGIVLTTPTTDQFTIRDIHNRQWVVVTTHVQHQDGDVMTGRLVLMVGQQRDDTTFDAIGIKVRDDDEPFGPPHFFSHRPLERK